MHLKHIRLLTGLVIALSIHLSCYGQYGGIQELTQNFDRYRKNSLHEKLYMHLDRTFYITGETMWFKIYVVDASFHKPLDLSAVAYVELLDANQQAVLQSKVAIKNGFAGGSLFLPATLNSGNYVLRAYTQWMKNSSADFFFHQNITVVNTFVSPSAAEAVPVPPRVVTFFPEGGNLVHGLRSRVAFKISGQPEETNFTGVVVTAGNDTLTTFKSEHGGIGSFYLTPLSSQKLRVRITDDAGAVSTHELPATFSEGMVMHVTDSLDFVNVLVKVNMPSMTHAPVYLFIHSRQVITHSLAQRVVHGEASFTLNKNSLRAGISHFTIFDASLKPFCERLYFRYPEKKLNIGIAQERTQFGTRRKVKLELSSTLGNKPTTANLSVAVVRTDSLPSAERAGIASYLMLLSDLPGTVPSPGFYFSGHALASRAMDHLMLTHGWRRFRWEQVLTKSAGIKFAPEYRSHLVRVQVLRRDGKPARHVNLHLSAPGKIVRLYAARTDTSGYTTFETNDFWDRDKVVVQAVNAKDSSFTIKVLNPFSTEKSLHNIGPFSLPPPGKLPYLLDRSIGMQVEDVYHPNRRNNIPVAGIDSLSFYGKASESYNLDDFTRFPVMEEVLREYVPGVMVRKRDENFVFLIAADASREVLAGEPLILVDGIPVSDPNQIMAFDPRLVQKLEVVTRRYCLNNQTFPGIISFVTYDGNFPVLALPGGSTAIDYESLQRQSEFYNPQYENDRQRSSPIPDQRQLLYWAPTVMTTSEGKQVIEFYTSDAEGNYQVNIEGITPDGHAGDGTFFFTVKRFDH